MPKNDSDTYIIKDLYERKEKIFPRQVNGIFAKFRILSVIVLLGVFYSTPWLTWNTKQAILLDLPERKFHLFSITFWPQDFVYLTLLLVICAVGLFLFTAIGGRLWCGYTCPQTVWTETFLWIEELVEGNRNKRLKLEKQSWGIEKTLKKAAKHFLWISFALFTGYTFVGYFSPIKELWHGISALTLGGWEWFWIGLYSLATYGNAGWLREQVCLYMCPYARFQSAMFDKDTLIISYDEKRGESRGKRKKKSDYQLQGLGDCIDCHQCVHVCPTGIDIRNGLQYECIACAACIDICDDVMDKMGYEKGLIKYTTEHAEQGKETKVFRLRTLLYITLFCSLVIAFFYLISVRQPLDVNVIKDRATLYVEKFNGDIENTYQLKILNMSQQDKHYAISVSGIENVQIIGDTQVAIGAGEVFSFPIRISASPKYINARSNNIYFEVTTLDRSTQESVEKHVTKGRFLGPKKK